jgi:hypothetical protein
MRDIFTLFMHAIVVILRSTWRTAFGCCRVRLDATSSPDSESWSEACSQPSDLGSHHCRPVYLANASSACFAVGCRLKDLDSAAFSQNLFSPKRVRRPGPKGPTKELIGAVIEMKRRNRTWGCKRIAQQIASPSAWTSTKTWSAGFSQYTSIRKPDREVRPGSPLSGTRKTHCGRWIYFNASPQYYERTGFWS